MRSHVISLLRSVASAFALGTDFGHPLYFS